DWRWNWGPGKCDASRIPPIFALEVMRDAAVAKGDASLPAHPAIRPADLGAAPKKRAPTRTPGSVGPAPTPALRFSAAAGGDHAKIGPADSAGITVESAKWLVEQNGAMMIGSDTSGLEYNPVEADTKAFREKYGSFMPVHNYLLIQQGVHIAEFHYLEEL